MKKEEPISTYFISQKNNLVVICFSGPLTKDSVATLEQCYSQIEKMDFRQVVISLGSVPSIATIALAPFAKIQKLIRHKPAGLRVCDMQESVAALLLEQGLIRQNERASDIRQAISVSAAAGA